MTRPSAFVRRAVPVVAATIAMLGVPGVAHAATTWVVNGAAPGCSDTGPGSATTPFCKIAPAATRAVAGDTVLVHPAVYAEQVVPPSGAAGNPVTFVASGPGVKILGSRDLSDAAAWTQVSATTWSRPFTPPSSQPQMLFVDSTILTKVTDPAALAPNQWAWDNVARIVYANVGGPNPAVGHKVEIGALSYGFNLAGKNNVVVDGFEFARQNFHAINIAPSLNTNIPTSSVEVRNLSIQETGSYGINVDATPGGSIAVVGNTVTKAGSHGIRLRNSSGIDVRGNVSHHNILSGIALHASSNNQVTGNVAYGNAKPNDRVSNGIDINAALINNVSVGSSNNTIKNNVTYENQDSGIQVYNGSNNNLIVRNLSYRNGDHGFDTLRSTGTRYISNTAHGNFKDGISIEGLSTNTTVRNNIATDNGLTTDENELFVDDDGTAQGFSSDYNIFRKTGPGVVVDYNDVEYPSIGAYALATGHEAHGSGADPRFVNPGAGDFHVGAGSPAIDSADASVAGFAAQDLEGKNPVDDWATVNSGAGTPAFADRGVYEYQPPPNIPPTASLRVSPSTGRAPLNVIADARASRDPDGTIAHYRFDWGDGTAMSGPQASALAGHRYTKSGTYTVTVTVTDNAGATATATAQVNITNTAPRANLSVTPSFGRAPLLVAANASASTDGDGTITSYRFNWGDGTANTGPQPGPTATHTYTQNGFYVVTLTVTDNSGASATTTAFVWVSNFFSAAAPTQSQT